MAYAREVLEVGKTEQKMVKINKFLKLLFYVDINIEIIVTLLYFY